QQSEIRAPRVPVLSLRHSRRSCSWHQCCCSLRSPKAFCMPSMHFGHGFILNDMPLGPVAKPTRLISPARVMVPYTSHLSPSPQAIAISSCASESLVQHLPMVSLPSPETTSPLHGAA